MARRYGAQVPSEDFSVQGQRIAYKARYRGQDLVLMGTVQYRIWDRNYGMNFWRIQPDRLEEYGNLTHFVLSVRDTDIVKEQ